MATASVIPVVGALLALLTATSCRRAPERPVASSERRGQLRERLRQSFPARYRDPIEVLWEPGDPPLLPEVLGNVKPSQVFAYFSGTTAVFPPANVTTRCAVVGSSGNLLGARQGATIDAHDLVFRMNLAPTRGFEADVGRRTTHYVVTWRFLDMILDGRGRDDVSTAFDSRLASLSDTAYWLAAPRPLGALTNTLRMAATTPSVIPAARTRIIHPDFLGQTETWKNEWEGPYEPSTGFMAILLAAHVCDAVDAYGFGRDATGARSYYYKSGQHGSHAPDVEEMILRQLVHAGVIAMYPDLAGAAPRPDQ